MENYLLSFIRSTNTKPENYNIDPKSRQFNLQVIFYLA